MDAFVRPSWPDVHYEPIEGMEIFVSTAHLRLLHVRFDGIMDLIISGILRQALTVLGT